MKTGPSLPSAAPIWEPGHSLRAGRFDDIYFSRDDGPAEKRHVFVAGCGLPEGWRDARAFTVAELGFGTGLNFLMTWDAWRRHRPAGARLHYIAVEGFPLAPGERAEIAATWPALRPLAAALARSYPTPQRGFHRVDVAMGDGDDPVTLTLLFGEAGANIARIIARGAPISSSASIGCKLNRPATSA